MQLPPPLLTHRLRNPPTSSPSASLLIRLISTIGCDHTGGENRRRSSSAGYLESYHRRIHLFIFPFFLLSSLDPRLCVSIRERQLDLFFFLFLLLSGYLRVNVGLIITAMTGKLAEKLPLTMSSLINTIPDNLYPEEDIPTSMNIFTNTESISHYSQMNTGKMTYFPLHFFASRSGESAMCAEGNSCLRAWSTCLRQRLLRLKVYCYFLILIYLTFLWDEV